MKNFFRSIAMTFSMFSVFPMPRVDWKQENMRYMLAQLPLVGVVIGGCLWVWARICACLGFSPVLTAAGLTLLPVVLSGAIHMDGFCDTADALASHADMEKKRAILKDSHTGAFAVIYTAVYLLALFAVTYELVCGGQAAAASETSGTQACGIGVFWVIQVLSRAIGGFASAAFPRSSANGLLAAFHDAAKKGSAVALTLWILACIAVAGFLTVPAGIAFALASFLCLFFLWHMAKKQFGGMSGDLAGFIITLSQLVLAAAYIIAVRLD